MFLTPCTVLVYGCFSAHVLVYGVLLTMSGLWYVPHPHFILILKHCFIFWSVRHSYITLSESIMCFTDTLRLVSCWYNSLKSITTTDSSIGAQIGDMISGEGGGQRRGDDFADVSGDQLGMLVHAIWWYV